MDARTEQPPRHAWSWLQRSRPVLDETARRLTGQPPEPGFVDDLRARYADDAFVRDVVIGAVVDVAFAGRVPRRRPPGAVWDRGLTWWAATVAGVTPAELEAAGRDAGGRQGALFDVHPPRREPGRPRPGPGPVTPAAVVAERAALRSALRRLLLYADESDRLPADAVRDLLARLSGGRPPGGQDPPAPGGPVA